MIQRDPADTVPPMQSEADAAAAAARETPPEPPPEPAAAAADEAPMPRLADDADDAAVGRVAAALIFAADRALAATRLSEWLGHPAGKIRSGIAAWNEKLASIGAPFSIVEIAGGYRFLTDPELAPFVAGLRGEQKKERLSAAALETLAIVAYRQPVTKGEIEAVRGVQAGPILRALLDRRFIRVAGRAPVPGRPLQYGTTKEFLDRFSLASIKDLPTVEELGKA